jgi:hypothetical protein
MAAAIVVAVMMFATPVRGYQLRVAMYGSGTETSWTENFADESTCQARSHRLAHQFFHESAMRPIEDQQAALWACVPWRPNPLKP